MWIGGMGVSPVRINQSVLPTGETPVPPVNLDPSNRPGARTARVLKPIV